MFITWEEAIKRYGEPVGPERFQHEYNKELDYWYWQFNERIIMFEDGTIIEVIEKTSQGHTGSIIAIVINPPRR